jgi:hypothetical protein
MEEETENKTCGCDCENCMKGDHQACVTGLCKYKAPDATDDTK